MDKKPQFKSVRPFIGTKDYTESRNFYRELGFSELIVSENMCYFKIDENIGFYLQNAFVKDWVENSMLFIEIEKLEEFLVFLKSKKLSNKFKNIRLSEIVVNSWGKEFFLHDTSGILWHFGNFN